MADEKNDAAEVEEVEDLPEGEAEIDWQAEARKREGIAKRYKTQASKFKADLEEERKKSSALAKNDSPSKKEGFDYSEKAYLKASGIQATEFDLVKEVMDATGKSLDEVLDNKHFQAELKDRRDAQASKDAIPTSSKRSAASGRDSVEYWIAKGELPPADQRELRTKVVNAKMKASQEGNKFSSRPVV
jgi:hypothetical protein